MNKSAEENLQSMLSKIHELEKEVKNYIKIINEAENKKISQLQPTARFEEIEWGNNELQLDETITFATQFKKLRLKYEIPLRVMANFLNLKSNGNIAFWEKEKQRPSMEVFQKITLLFGVSADWLLGHTQEPYNAHFISALEKRLCVKLIALDISIPVVYQDEMLRKENYSLEERADIIFFLQALQENIKYLPLLCKALNKELFK